MRAGVKSRSWRTESVIFYAKHASETALQAAAAEELCLSLVSYRTLAFETRAKQLYRILVHVDASNRSAPCAIGHCSWAPTPNSTRPRRAIAFAAANATGKMDARTSRV